RHCPLFTSPLGETLHPLYITPRRDIAPSLHHPYERHCPLFTSPLGETLPPLYITPRRDIAPSLHHP
ncbi:predicted protein, partial [Nematostella vectensis]